MTAHNEVTSNACAWQDDVARRLAHAGLVLVAFELIRSLVVKPIRTFYSHTIFGPGLPFKSYEHDVLSRHKNEFEACLLYLKDFMRAIDDGDIEAIQALRHHRNELAHELPARLKTLNVEDSIPLIDKARKALFKLSNYRTYIDIGSDPAFQDIGIDWDRVTGREYALLERVLQSFGEHQTNTHLLNGP